MCPRCGHVVALYADTIVCHHKENIIIWQKISGGLRNIGSHVGGAQEAAIFKQVVYSLQQKLINSDVCWIWAGWQQTQTITAFNSNLVLSMVCALNTLR